MKVSLWNWGFVLSGLARSYCVVCLLTGFALLTYRLPAALGLVNALYAHIPIVALFSALLGPFLAIMRRRMPIAIETWGSRFGVFLQILLPVSFIFFVFWYAYDQCQNEAIWLATPSVNVQVSGDQVQMSPAQERLPAQVLSRANFPGENGAGMAFMTHGEVDTLVPTVAYRFQPSAHLPLLYPVWTGEFIVHPNGSIERMDRAHAQQDDRLRGLPLYPRELAQRAFDGYTELPRGNSDTQFVEATPLLVRGSASVYWLLPLQERAAPNRIDAIIFVDARTGERFVHTESRGLVSSDRALGDAQRSAIAANWPWNSPASAPTQVVDEGVSIRANRLFWHWSEVRAGQTVANIWIDSATEAPLTMLPTVGATTAP